MQPDINIIAVLLAGVASMVIGFLWYSKLLFGPAWQKARGLSDEALKADAKSVNKFYALSFVLSLITAYVLAHVMAFSDAYYHYPPLQTGLYSAFYMWLGFVMPVQFTGELFGDRKWKVFFINTGYQLVWLLKAGLIIGWMM